MLKVFQFLNKPYRVKKEEKDGRILNTQASSMDEIEKIYEEWRDKSIREGVYYLKGSDYMKELILKYPNPELFDHFFLQAFDRIDSKKPAIPLEIGHKIEELLKDKSMRLGIHRSGEIVQPNLREDKVLQSIMKEGLVNNGAAMQGLVASRVHPSHTVSNASDPILAFSTIKSSFRGSTGDILVGLPSDLVDVDFDFKDHTGDDIIYRVDSSGIRYIRPEYILGYLDCREDNFHFYSRDELLQNQKELF